jgi:hypothetical protein
MVQQRQFSHSFDTGPTCQLEVDLTNARLAVRGEERQDVYVQVSLTRGSPELDLEEIVRQVEAAIVQEGSRVRIAEPSITERSWQLGQGGINFAVAFSSGFRLGRLSTGLRFEYELRVPRDTEVQIDSGNGSIALAAVKGPVRLHAGNGQVSVEDIERDVRVESENNKVTVGHVGGALTVASENGALRIERVAGPTQVRSQNGRISLRDLHAGLLAESENGRIEYEGEIRSDFDLKTENGAILLNVPASSRFELDAESRQGSVECDLSVREERPASDTPAPKVRLRSGNGGIRIRELVLPGAAR